MKNLSKTQTVLSELSVNADSSATFTCTVDSKDTLQLILHDNLGRSRLKKDFSLSKGTNSLRFKLPKLKKGSYSAWFEVNGESFVRTLIVDKNMDSESGILSKFKEWLNLF